MSTTWRLTARELYLLCEFAERPWPVLFDEPETASHHDEHLDDNREVAQDLRDRGLADGAGPIGAAAELVHALREGERAHLVVVGGEVPVLATAVFSGTTGLVLLQREDIVVVRSSRSRLADVLLGFVRPVPGADSTPIALPRAALTAARDQTSELAVERVLADHGVDRATQRRWVAALHPAVSDGQFGRDTRQELRWLDSPRGRFRLDERDGWISANPLHPADMHHRFRQVIG